MFNFMVNSNPSDGKWSHVTPLLVINRIAPLFLLLELVSLPPPLQPQFLFWWRFSWKNNLEFNSNRNSSALNYG